MSSNQKEVKAVALLEEDDEFEVSFRKNQMAIFLLCYSTTIPINYSCRNLKMQVGKKWKHRLRKASCGRMIGMMMMPMMISLNN